MATRRFGVALTLVAFVLLAPVAAHVPADIPARFSDKEFWDLSEKFSESNGEFQSDNFLSNERGYQVVIPELMNAAKTGRIYLGVGPEQNYPYIIALKPALSIIFDVRRGNLHEQLLYKAIFEMSTDRVDFLSRLFCRPKPEGVTPASSVATIMAAFQTVSPTDEIYRANLKAVSDQLTVKHGFALHADDLAGIDYVYKTAFYNGGPNLTYSMAGRGSGGRGGGRGGSGGTYADIQALTDGAGVNRGFLASEENWKVIKDLQERNLILPVVGDFAGSKAIRGVGAWLKEQGAVVSAFYLSNVEQYLNRNGVEDVFICNVAQLPLDAASTFIYTGRGRTGAGFGGGGGGGLNVTFLRSMLDDARTCAKH